MMVVVADDGCSNACQLPACGDGVVQAGEACDDGNAVETGVLSLAPWPPAGRLVAAERGLR